MRFKRLLALLLAAALALAVLVGCGRGQQSAAQALLKLLDGKYPNISIEIDPDLEADLRQAISQAEAENAGDDAAAIRAALEKLVGSTVTFRNLGDGQQGDTTFDLVFYAGTDPDKAAQAAYSQWNIVFANVPDDGKYGTGLAMVETENGIWMLVKATVEKAGTEDKPEPATVTGISVSSQPKKTQYNKGEDFDPDGMVITVTYSDGSTKTISGDYSSKGVTWSPAKIDTDTDVTITYGGKTDTVAVKLITLESIEVTQNPNKTEYEVDESFEPDGMVVTAYYSNGDTTTILDSYNENGVTWTPANGLPAETDSVTITYTDDENRSKSTDVPVTVGDIVEGTGYRFNKDTNKATITGETGLQELFANATINAASANITLESPVTLDANWKGEEISFTGELNGNGNTITMKGNRKQGLFNEIGTGGKVLNVDIEVSGTISGGGHVGGIAGTLWKGTITGCSVELNGGSIQATATGTHDARTYACADGIASTTNIDGVECGPATGTGTSSSSDGSVTLFLKGNTVAVDPVTIQPDSYGIYTDGYARAGTKTA